MDQAFTQKVMKNTLSSVYARVWSLAISIVLIPYILRKLGNAEFGIWVFIAAFVGLVGLLDLGLRPSFVKYIAEYSTRGDQDAVSGVLSAGIMTYFILGALVVAVAYLSLDVILRFFTIPQGLEDAARLIVQLGLISLLAMSLMGVYQSVIDGLQRMDISNGISIFMSTCFAVGCVIVLESGFGIIGLAVSQLMTQAIGTVVTVCVAYRLYPGLTFNPRSAKKYISIILPYGLNLQISNVAGLVNFQFDKLLINHVIDAPHVTLYDIGSRLGAIARSFPVLLLSALTPATSELEVRKGIVEVYELFARASKYVSVVAFPIFAGAIVMAQFMIEVWIGPGYDRSVTVLRIVSIGYLLNTAAGGVSPLVQGMGRPDFQRNAELLSLLLNVVLTVVLLTQYGFYGAPIGTATAMSVAAGYYLWSFHRFMEQPLLRFVRSTFAKPALFAIIAGFVAWVMARALGPLASGGRVGALSILVPVGSIFGGVYLILIVRSRYLDERDMALFRRHLPFGPVRRLIRSLLRRS